MSNREVAIEYLNHFCTGNIVGVEKVLVDDFCLRGPLFEFHSRAEYISTLKNNPPEQATYEIIDILEEQDNVAIFYVYKKPAVSISVAQLFNFEKSKISETLLVFDPTALN